MAAKNIKIFIASAGEVRAEREKAILLLNDLRKAHKHLDLEAVEWEYDTVPGSQPGFDSVQDAINPKLAESHIAVFIFYSRIGHYTKVEFDLAQQLGKKFFVLFKEGFSPKDEEIAAYSDLLQFKKNLNKTVLHEPYADEKDFYSRLYRSLNVYLYETYPAMAGPLPEEVLKLLRDLAQKEDRIKELEGLLPASTNTDELQKLTAEIATIKNELVQSEALRQQQAADKAALEQQLAVQKESDQLKAQALEAVEKGDYIVAENLLQESAKDKMTDMASTFFELAKVKKLQLKYREAYEYYELAAKIAPANSDYLFEAGRMARQLGYADMALTYYEKSLPLAIAKHGERHPAIGSRLNSLALAYNTKGEYDRAIGYYEQSLAIDKEFYGERHPEIATRYSNLGLVYISKAEYDRAIGYYEQALGISKEFYGERHPDIAVDYNNLGLAYYHKGEYDRAIGYYEQALDIDLSVYGDQHPDIAIDYNNLGLAYYNKGEYDRAVVYYEQSLAIDKEFYGERHPEIATRYSNLGLVYISKAEYDRAIGYYEQALVIDKKFYGELHPVIATRYNNLGSAYRGKGEYHRAIGYYEQALEIGKEFYGERHPHIGTQYNNLGLAYYCKAEYDIAIEYYEQCLSILHEFLPLEHPYIAIAQEGLQVAKDAQAKGEKE